MATISHLLAGNSHECQISDYSLDDGWMVLDKLSHQEHIAKLHC